MGNSLAKKTPLIKGLESLLSPKHHAGTYSGITEHSPQAQVEEAASRLQQDTFIDTIISVGGGSPMDSAKNITCRTRIHRTMAIAHHNPDNIVSRRMYTRRGIYTGRRH
ncbi:uncharacterized protein N7503_008604 [Penicillium pulvis]|uniref:uncharacterized protein n=1 Tax=Penicillium pulvis TaxID=1562058 RepID=UPI00254898C1|nr:uncharacterized protein N7503_008604 [Penicillium pulvis]KAJ5792626.1 hypothetical protein N7503_008604 [Penicillium pulvis]